MTQSKKSSKSSKSSKKTTTASTAKKVKREASEKRVEVVVAPAVLETVTQTVEPVSAPVVQEAAQEAAPVRTLSRAEFMELVRKEAYSRAARRNFKNGSPFQDWVNAEAAVSGKLAAEGVRLS